MRGIVLLAALAAVGASAEPPAPLREAVPGRVWGWQQANLTRDAGREWVVAYHLLERRICDGEFNGTWKLAVVSAAGRRIIDRRFDRSFCGTGLMWLRVGRLTDGLHDEIAVDLAITPSYGHQARIFRVDGRRLRLVRTFNADGVPPRGPHRRRTARVRTQMASPRPRTGSPHRRAGLALGERALSPLEGPPLASGRCPPGCTSPATTRPTS